MKHQTPLSKKIPQYRKGKTIECMYALNAFYLRHDSNKSDLNVGETLYESPMHQKEESF